MSNCGFTGSQTTEKPDSRNQRWMRYRIDLQPALIPTPLHCFMLDFLDRTITAIRSGMIERTQWVPIAYAQHTAYNNYCQVIGSKYRVDNMQCIDVWTRRPISFSNILHRRHQNVPDITNHQQHQVCTAKTYDAMAIAGKVRMLFMIYTHSYTHFAEKLGSPGTGDHLLLPIKAL